MSQPETIHVLLIEDSAADADFVKRCLTGVHGQPFELVHSDRFVPGIRMALDGKFDVLLLDLYLPDSAGRETFERACAEVPLLPIILMTSMEDEQFAVAALRDGAQDYIVKRKVDREVLVRAIRYAIERKRAARELMESQERFALAMLGANDGIWDWDLRTGRVFFSTRWKEMLGFMEHEIGDDPEEWLGRIHPDDRDRVMGEIELHHKGAIAHFECEHLMKHRDGSFRWYLSRGLAMRGDGGKVYRMAGSQTDVTKRKSAEVQLRHEALHDSLTNLPNRALLTDHLSMAIAHTRRRRDYQFAVLFVDIDRFKVVNDSLGHVVGDQLLVGVARRIQALLRPSDTVARLGGDEFVILIEDIADLRDATRVATRVHLSLEKPFQLGTYEVTTTASIGIALSATGYDQPEQILRDADTAMYRAKSRGRSRHEVFDIAMHADALSMLKLESDLRRAVEKQEFIIHYQPIVSLEHGHVLRGFEALVRWVHPERGVVYPSEFIPLAEETGMIMPLGLWVLREACRQMKDWQGRFPASREMTMSVNLSSRQLFQPNFVGQVEDILTETGLDARHLNFEMTESMILDSEPGVMITLRGLKDLGVRLQIDDFGTGYSSLSYLHRFPIDHLKIDRSFIHRMHESGENLEIVRTITNLASSLKMAVIAEGVENPGQISMLKDLAVKEGQGYFFSRPLDSESIASLYLGAPVA